MEINFLKSIFLGFLIALPVSPIGILCVQRTLQFGRFSGLLSCLGIATTSAAYAILTVFELNVIFNFLFEGQFWLRLIGGAFLLYLGWKIFLTKINTQPKDVAHLSLSNDFLSTFFLTITNPMATISFLATFASFRISDIENSYFEASGSYFKASILVLGIFLGSAIWWLLVSEGVTLFRKKISIKVMKLINRVAGLIIMGCAIIILLIAILFLSYAYNFPATQEGFN